MAVALAAAATVVAAIAGNPVIFTPIINVDLVTAWLRPCGLGETYVNLND